ncbi:hypothetical protein [Lutibacter sp. B1]|uniref:hypothetical protein n=1 Tax=Lutibacter sp. B1 TaxID=2725996 RepID=UPI00145638BF|nr:hypothetical protein [Lutibacter sp. B1]NLP59249.1 hypothetical protein [Lutibacter sp. B1]
MLAQFIFSKSLFGSGGAFVPMLKNVKENALQVEKDAYLDCEQRSSGNKRNGNGKKKLKSDFVSLLAVVVSKKLCKLKSDTIQNFV